MANRSDEFNGDMDRLRDSIPRLDEIADAVERGIDADPSQFKQTLQMGGIVLRVALTERAGDIPSLRIPFTHYIPTGECTMRNITRRDEDAGDEAENGD